MIEEKNAKITSTSLGKVAHGTMSFYIGLKYSDSSGQSFGGYGLDTPIKDKDGNFIRRQGTDYGLDAIIQVLDAVGVDTWEELIGKSIRVRAEHNKVHAIGHYLEDNWYDIEEHAKSGEFDRKTGKAIPWQELDK